MTLSNLSSRTPAMPFRAVADLPVPAFVQDVCAFQCEPYAPCDQHADNDNFAPHGFESAVTSDRGVVLLLQIAGRC